MILLAYRRGLRVSELVDLRWEQIDFTSRPGPSQAGYAERSPLQGDELRTLRQLQRERFAR